MKILAASQSFCALIISSLVITGCSATPEASQLHNSTTRSATGSLPSMPDTSSGAPVLTEPAVVSVDPHTGALEYWQKRPGGHSLPIRISKKGLFNGTGGLVANGRVISFGNQNPAEVLQFNVDTKAITTLPDPYGIPIDIAIGKDNSLYVLNLVRSQPNNVAWYPGGAPNPKELACSALDYGANVAVDNEGNLYVGGYVGQSAGIIKFPNGPNGPDPSKCKTLDLGLGSAYMVGLVVDPKTDDLVTLTDPDLCAGGVEGLMSIFPKPYRRETGISHIIGQNCSFNLRLSGDSKTVFILDTGVDGGITHILQRSFPDGVRDGSYHGGQPGSLTTIPNTLPN